MLMKVPSSCLDWEVTETNSLNLRGNFLKFVLIVAAHKNFKPFTQMMKFFYNILSHKLVLLVACITCTASEAACEVERN